jgi:hypothetical protein
VADHPVKVPKELAQQWIDSNIEEHTERLLVHGVADRAAQWGADQELEACIDVLGSQSAWDVLAECTGWKEFRDESEDILRAARRPKPPSLAEQGLEVVRQLKNLGSVVDLEGAETKQQLNVLEEALTRLAELEAQQ